MMQRFNINGRWSSSIGMGEPPPDLPAKRVDTHTQRRGCMGGGQWKRRRQCRLAARTTPQRVQVLELKENLGFAAGYNRALEHIDADMYVLLNSDVRVDGPWVTPVLECMDEQDWDVASPRVVQDVDPRLCEHAGAAGGWMDKDGYPFCLGRIFNAVEPVKIGMRATGKCFGRQERASSSENLLGASRMVSTVPCLPTWKKSICAGGSRTRGAVGCVGTVRVRHLGGGTLQTTSPFKTYLNFRNNLVVMLKNRDGFLAWIHVSADGLGWDCGLDAFQEGTGVNFLLWAEPTACST